MQIPLSQRTPFPTYDRVARLDEAATILGISTWTLKRRSKAGEIKILKLSPRRLGVRLSEIQRYLDASEAA
jgi:predicted site-specific integrase-resolvase